MDGEGGEGGAADQDAGEDLSHDDIGCPCSSGTHLTRDYVVRLQHMRGLDA